MRAFLETGIGGHSKAVYVSFSHSPVTMKKKVGELFDEPKFTWVDCCADGKGRGAAPSRPHPRRLPSCAEDDPRMSLEPSGAR